jgi:ubiquinone/menaquinone biosynthesis C-methylase UbiE
MTRQPEISRVTRSKQQAITAYDQLSRWYDRFSASSEQPLAELGLKKLNASGGETVLEIGFGTGQALLALASAVGEAGKVIGIDISRGMFRVASGKISHAKLSHRIILEQADAVNLPFETGSFDAIFISFTLELFDTPEITTVLSECRRVLKPGGRIGVVVMARDAHENIPVCIYEWFHKHLPIYVDCRPIYVQSALTLAGFEIQDITREWMWGLPVEICLAKTPQFDAEFALANGSPLG